MGKILSAQEVKAIMVASKTIAAEMKLDQLYYMLGKMLVHGQEAEERKDSPKKRRSTGKSKNRRSTRKKVQGQEEV